MTGKTFMLSGNNVCGCVCSLFCRHEKDLVLFHNRGVLHTVVGAFKPDQVRAFHQCNLAASDDPVGPSAEDVQKWA